MQHTSSSFINLPEINDFKSGGKFYKIKNLSAAKCLPDEIIQFIYPDEYKKSIFNPELRRQFKSKKYDRLKHYCLNLKKSAMVIEKDIFLKQKKELEKRQMEEYFTKHLEEKIKEYYNNYYKTLYDERIKCKCELNVENKII